MNFILDALVVLLLATTIINSARKGFARSVIEFVGYFAALFVSAGLSIPLGNWIYTTFLTPFVEHTVTARIESSINTAAGTAVNSAATLTQSQLDRYLSQIPASMQGFLSHYGFGADAVATAASGAVTQNSSTVARSIAERLVLPIAQQAGRALAFALLFFLCMVAVRFLARAAGRVTRLPVLHTLDRTGGALIGVVKGLLLVCLAAVVLSFLVPLWTLNKNPAISQSDIDNSTVFRAFYNYNPVSQLLLKK